MICCNDMNTRQKANNVGKYTYKYPPVNETDNNAVGDGAHDVPKMHLAQIGKRNKWL